MMIGQKFHMVFRDFVFVECWTGLPIFLFMSFSPSSSASFLWLVSLVNDPTHRSSLIGDIFTRESEVAEVEATFCPLLTTSVQLTPVLGGASVGTADVTEAVCCTTEITTKIVITAAGEIFLKQILAMCPGWSQTPKWGRLPSTATRICWLWKARVSGIFWNPSLWRRLLKVSSPLWAPCLVQRRIATSTFLKSLMVGWFYGILTFVGYLMPNPFLCK